MPAIPNFKPVPERTVAPEEHSPKGQPPKRKKLLWAVAIVSVVIVIGVLALQQLGAKPESAAPPTLIVPTAKATTGPLERTLRIGGVTSSSNYVNVTTPRLAGPEAGRELILLSLVQSGTLVKKGDLVAQIDGESFQEHMDDVMDSVRNSEADIRKRKAEHAVDWENLQQTLRVAKADLDKMKLEAAASEIRTSIDQELLRLAVEESEARFKQLQADEKQKRIAHAAELRILDIARERHVNHHDRHLVDIQKFTMRAPMDGLAVIQPIFRSGEMSMIQAGDQVRPGQLLLKVVETDSMQLDASANQSQSSELRVGQKVRVGLDAFPGLQFPGHIFSMGALAKGGFRENFYIRNVPVSIVIEGSDPRLIPDLSGYADVILERQDSATLVPLSAVHREEGKTFVFVRKADAGFDRREIQLGLTSGSHAAVVSGLEAGAEVALRRP